MHITTTSAGKHSMQVTATVKAPRQAVYEACIDAGQITQWRVPDNMLAIVHEFDARPGGSFHMSLKYRDANHPAAGKTDGDTDTFHGRFVEIVPGVKIVEVVVFDSADPAFAGEMTLTTSFADAPGGTQITMRFDDMPAGVRPADNDAGTRQSLKKLAALVEQ